MSRSYKRPGWSDANKAEKRWTHRKMRRFKDFLIKEDYIGDIDLSSRISIEWGYHCYRFKFRSKKHISIRVEIWRSEYPFSWMDSRTVEEETIDLMLSYLRK